MRRRLIAAWLAAVAVPAVGATVPNEALRLRADLIRNARAVWGINAPVARFAAQIQQESAWRPAARSRYAEGLAQFTPATAAWIAQAYPRLGAAAPYSPQWAIRALVTYDRHLYLRILPRQGRVEACDRWAMTLSAYNGGLGWVGRDRALAARAGADPDRWWRHVERYSPRADWARRENRDYPRRILLRWEPIYRQAGWPGEAVCWHV
ncbi:MAG: transglycosylase SLT domain-containing protein [Pseudomonadota bacterium]